MKVQGRIWKVLPIRSGISNAGNPYKAQEFVFEFYETGDQRYADRVPLVAMNEEIEKFNLHEGEEVIIGFDHRADEYQGRYYPKFKIYHFEKVTAATPGAQDAGGGQKVDVTAEQREAMEKLKQMGNGDGNGENGEEMPF